MPSPCVLALASPNALIRISNFSSATAVYSHLGPRRCCCCCCRRRCGIAFSMEMHSLGVCVRVYDAVCAFFVAFLRHILHSHKVTHIVAVCVRLYRAVCAYPLYKFPCVWLSACMECVVSLHFCALSLPELGTAYASHSLFTCIGAIFYVCVRVCMCVRAFFSVPSSSPLFHFYRYVTDENFREHNNV